MSKHQDAPILNTPYISGVVQNLINKIQNNPPSKADVTVTVGGDVVRDITLLTGGETMEVANISLFVMAKPGKIEELLRLQERINEIHSRHVLVADIMPDGIVPVTFHEKESEFFVRERLKKYHGVDAQQLITMAADDIWNFLRDGTRPD